MSDELIDQIEADRREKMGNLFMAVLVLLDSGVPEKIVHDMKKAHDQMQEDTRTLAALQAAIKRQAGAALTEPDTPQDGSAAEGE